MTLVRALVAVRRARIWEFQLEDSWQMVVEKLRCEGDDRLMSQFGLNFLDLDGPCCPPYWLSVGHAGPCWLCVTRAAPVGLRALGSGVRHLFCASTSLLGSATAHKVCLRETGECLTLWVGPPTSCEKVCFQHAGGSSVHILPFFIWSVNVLWIMVEFSPQSCLALRYQFKWMFMWGTVITLILFLFLYTVWVIFSWYHAGL